MIIKEFQCWLGVEIKILETAVIEKKESYEKNIE
jgi:hypothetical protein